MPSAMYAYLLGMYLRGVLTEEALDAAVAKGRITQAEADQIRAAKAEQDAAVIASTDAAINQELTS